MFIRLAGFIITVLCGFPVLAMPLMGCFDKQIACNQSCIAKMDMACIDVCTKYVQACLDVEEAMNGGDAQVPEYAINEEEAKNTEYVKNEDVIQNIAYVKNDEGTENIKYAANMNGFTKRAGARDEAAFGKETATKFNLSSSDAPLQVAEASTATGVVDAVFYTLLRLLLR